MKKKSAIITILLYPLALIYGMIVAFRNLLFNIGILKSKRYKMPIICVGNITVGGTGKTPFSEYLIRLLSDKYNVGVLSRGYKRKTKGYILSNNKSNATEIGDEPCQMKKKFPKTIIAVDEDRRRGIENMNLLCPKPDLIILDDAFQHRYVKPGLSILLVDHSRLITEDNLLPLGQLREPVKSKDRADIVVITKCPLGFTPIDSRIIAKKMNLFPYQKLFFTKIVYDNLMPVFDNEQTADLDIETLKDDNYTILSIAGIASPRPFERFLRRRSKNLITMTFPDHYNFSKSDLESINKNFLLIKSNNKIIVTTEKDATRLKSDTNLPQSLRKYMYYIPVKVSFLMGGETKFENKILEYVEKNKRQ